MRPLGAQGDQDLAERAAAAMFREDRNAQAMGMTVSAVAPGSATVSLAVSDTMVNGLDVCHGGIIFALADTAMAFASNSRGGTNLASGASIDFLAPVRLGEEMVASAVELFCEGRVGVYSVTVSVGDSTVALLRGKTKRVSEDGPGS